jgi:hypothetical protein
MTKPPRMILAILGLVAMAILGIAAGVSFDEIHTLFTEAIGAMQ